MIVRSRSDMIAVQREARQPMGKRPISVTVIAWILMSWALISSCLGAMLIFDYFTLPISEIDLTTGWLPMNTISIPTGVQDLTFFAGSLTMFVSGVAILKQKNWGRWLFVIGSGADLVVGSAAALVKEQFIPYFVAIVVLTFLLF